MGRVKLFHLTSKRANREKMSSYLNATLLLMSLFSIVLVKTSLAEPIQHAIPSMEPELIEYDYPEPAYRPYYAWRRAFDGRFRPGPHADGRLNKKSFLLDSRLG
ncbi:unnamed protein product [Echinostoma caproni]|uniref:Uncharacterized protein n=1 Tax=Echinostoma caproni TaxID=27848 RepID=A0A183AIG0_9TREM|nr:unnamed protein product [Echinostoma caproni]